MAIRKLLLILAFVFLAIATLGGSPAGSLNLVALGLALWVLSLLV